MILAEARRELGGRVTAEAGLPGLSEWARVRDYRVQQLHKLANVGIYLESELAADDVLAVGAEHVAIATGAAWRRDGLGRANLRGIAPLDPAARIFTPDDVMAGRLPQGRALIFDDDGYYMAAVVAERVAETAEDVTLVTPEEGVAAWAAYTGERPRTLARLRECGVKTVVSRNLEGFDGSAAQLVCTLTGAAERLPADALVLVTAREPEDSLYRELADRTEAGVEGAPHSLRRIGDCEAPAIIAAAVYAGHRYARELDAPETDATAVPHDRPFDEDPSSALVSTASGR